MLLTYLLINFFQYLKARIKLNFTKKISTEEVKQQERISDYYKFQSKIYDWTRWAFLFGRLKILKQLPYKKTDKFRLAEIGSGTGFNLEYLGRKYDHVALVGVDVSREMMFIARDKILHFPNTKVFYQLPYNSNSTFLKEPQPDVILFSYALTMINPQWKNLIKKAYEDLPVGGRIMVVDFYDSKFKFFKNHMSNHHVRMDGHILPELKSNFKTIHESVNNAYGGVWQYFMYVGEK